MKPPEKSTNSSEDSPSPLDYGTSAPRGFDLEDKFVRWLKRVPSQLDPRNWYLKWKSLSTEVRKKIKRATLAMILLYLLMGATIVDGLPPFSITRRHVSRYIPTTTLQAYKGEPGKDAAGNQDHDGVRRRLKTSHRWAPQTQPGVMFVLYLTLPLPGKPISFPCC